MRRAFSLIELLLSVFILAIGIISVSALFPAGIAQQQQTADDQLGPVVAEQALGLLRSRVKSEDFGTLEEFGVKSLGAVDLQWQLRIPAQRWRLELDPPRRDPQQPRRYHY